MCYNHCCGLVMYRIRNNITIAHKSTVHVSSAMSKFAGHVSIAFAVSLTSNVKRVYRLLIIGSFSPVEKTGRCFREIDSKIIFRQFQRNSGRVV